MELSRYLEDRIKENLDGEDIAIHELKFFKKLDLIRIYMSTSSPDVENLKSLVDREIDDFFSESARTLKKEINIVAKEWDLETPEDVRKLCFRVFSEEPMAKSFFKDATFEIEDASGMDTESDGKDSPEGDSEGKKPGKRIFIRHYGELICSHMVRKRVPAIMQDYIRCLYNEEYSIVIKYDSGLVEPLTMGIPEMDLIPSAPTNGGTGTEMGVKVRTETQSQPKAAPPRKKEVFTKPSAAADKDENIIYGKGIKGEVSDIRDLTLNMKNAVIAGEVFKVDTKELRSGKVLYNIYVYDGDTSILCKAFVEQDVDLSGLTAGIFAKFKGTLTVDTYMGNEEAFIVYSIVKYEGRKKTRKDTAERKRIELHAHTMMSAMDAIIEPKKLVKTAISWGHEAIAITDHGVVQAYPEAMDTGRTQKEEFIKVIYGLEAYVVDDMTPVVTGDSNIPFTGEYVVFDIETTGFSNNNDAIIEIGAVKVADSKVVDRFSAFVDPERPIPAEIVELTGINDSMVRGQAKIKEVLPDFLEFCGDRLLVAHNANFDMGFIRRNAERLNLPFDNEQMDTVLLARYLFPDLKRHRLDTIAKALAIPMGSHHRAVDDAETTARILLRSFEILEKEGITDTDGLNRVYLENFDVKKGMPHHAVILAKNQAGLKKIYELVSISHLEHFQRNPRIPKSLLMQERENLLIGSACSSSELYRAILDNRKPEIIERIADFYDYLEVMPIRNNTYLMSEGRCTEDELKDHVRYIIALGDRLGKPVAATGDVHMLNEEDEEYRRIIRYSQPLTQNDVSIPLPFLTTSEMLEEFSFLSDYQRDRVVIDATHEIADMIESCIPIPYETYPPKMEGAEEEIRNMTMENAYRKYGNPLPELIQKRLDKELNSIIGNGYAVLYLVAHKLVKKSLDDGYLVGSRGSVGSSFVATMTDITEVNGLPAHYVCPQCRYSEFIADAGGSSGVDLPPKKCPECGAELDREGHDIPFETFLGFEGDKEPDIDLNFSGEYQPVVHKYCEELFGEKFVYRAGTIGTVAEKTAKGYVRKYFEEKGLRITTAELERISQGCTGIKRTTGQHPGGIMVVPSDNDIHNFCPVQYPADDAQSGVKTTHFDYHSISGRLLKLDILGHDDPTMLRMLEDISGVAPKDIPLNDPEVLSIFTGTEALGVKPEELGSPVGTYGIPEFGTKFVRQMLVDTKPQNFSDLVRISGLSHGTNVWVGNAQDYIKNGDTDLAGCISLRDNIMLFLIAKGLPPKEAFFITEKVRKGKGLKPEDEALMRENQVPEWYIESCKKIKYMFPKGHAVAYVTMAVRIAWFKVHMPLHYYAAYFSVRAKDFDAELVLKGESAVKERLDSIVAQGFDASNKDQVMVNVLELIYEMFRRGFTFHPVDLYRSHATKFLVDDGCLIPPLSSVSGVPESQAESIYEAAKKGEFMSKEDFKIRTGATRSVIEALDTVGCFKGIGETNQLTFF